jgi:hypothetical protein
MTTEEKLRQFNQLCDELNLQTIVSFSKKHGITYNGVQYKKNLRTNIQGIELIVDL